MVVVESRRVEWFEEGADAGSRASKAANSRGGWAYCRGCVMQALLEHPHDVGRMRVGRWELGRRDKATVQRCESGAPSRRVRQRSSGKGMGDQKDQMVDAISRRYHEGQIL